MDEKAKLVEAIEKAKGLELFSFADRCRKDLYYLAKEILDYELMTPHTHQNLCHVIESLILGPIDIAPRKAFEKMDGPRDVDIFTTNIDSRDLKKKFRLILMPRGSFKSTISTISFPLQILLFNPNARILIDSETFEKSRAFLSEIKGHLTSNEKYRKLYRIIHGVNPDGHREKWSDTELNVGGRTRKAKEPTISCAGVGVTKVGMHYDWIISDDLHSEKNVTTKDQIQQVIDHYKLNLSLLEPDGSMIVIGTRWDYNDLYQYILDREKHRFTTYAEQAERPDGSLLFPERLTKQFLVDQRRSQGSTIYSMQYQNMPIDDETATFKFSQMKRVDWKDIKDRPINWFITIDPAISQADEADFTAMVVAGFDYQKNLYVRHILNAKLTPSEIVDNLFRLFDQYRPVAVGLEVVAFQRVLKYAIEDEMKNRGWWLPLKELKRKNRQSKEDRIRALQPYYEYGHVYHLGDCAHIDDLEYQLIHFPKAKNDDIIDALADVLTIGFSPINRRGGESQEEVRRKKRKLAGILTRPRSKITRY